MTFNNINSSSNDANTEPYDERQTSRLICPGSDATDRVSQTREMLLNEFHAAQKNNNNCPFSNLDIAIKTIEALLVTNEEIFDRCKEMANNDVHHNYVDNPTFTKRCFNLVKVWTVVCSPYPTATYIVVFPQNVQKLFNLFPLFNLPPGLNVFQPTREKSGFIDYKSLFRTSLMLHDDMLLPYLSALKDHLEEIQVCLGEIESWLMEANNNIHFLETTFGITLDPKGTSTPWPTYCRCGDHKLTDICGYCMESYSKHKVKDDTLRHCISHPHAIFFCNREYHILGQYQMSGKFEAMFNISEEGEREQLRRLREFMEGGCSAMGGERKVRVD